MGPNADATLEFDEANEFELARRHVTVREVVQVFSNRPLWRANRRGRADNFQMIARTDGGRLLTIIVLWRGGERVLRPITGWDASTGERTVYEKSGQGEP